VLSVSLLCWEDKRLRESIKKNHAELRSIREMKEYASWLRCTRVDVRGGHGDAGPSLGVNGSSVTGSNNGL
jgi:hypothetical protein